ncbi:MAG: RNA polymerase sigma factor [Planctomycetota bacterium]
MTESDRDLIERTLRGDKAAFGTLVRRYQNILFGTVCSFVKNRSDAEELTQETFFKAYNALGQLRDRDKFVGWLRMIARNISLDWMKKERKKKSALDRLPEPQAKEKEEESPFTEPVLREVERLSDIYRVVIQLRYLEGYSLKQIASALGVPGSTVRNRLWRAHETLKERLHPLIQKRRDTDGLPQD